MTANILDGKKVSAQLKDSIKLAVRQLQLKTGHTPGLAVVLVGDNPASKIYVNVKRRTCDEVGFNSFAYDLPETSSEEALLGLIDELNKSDQIDGILVQLPLPEHIDTVKIIESIDPQKDVDGFHPYNIGRLAQRHPLLRPCTPYGIIQLLEFYQISLEGKHAVVVGASNIVGRPMALEFLLTAATVTICHRFTKNLEQHVRSADVLVVATGVRHVVDVKWLQQDQIIIDVGMHRQTNGTLVGDIDFENAKSKVAWITPVPGGVGPMTIATLLQNTLIAAQNLLGSDC